MTEDVHMEGPRHETLLFVCTANICRSPMAEALLKAELSPRCSGVEVRSAGFMSEGRPADKKGVWAVQQLGVELVGHTSAHASSALKNDPQLILTMAREHLRMLSELDADAVSRAFTLKEFVRLADIEGERRVGETLSDYVSRVSAGRSVSAITSPGREDDIADPIGQRRTAFARCAHDLIVLVDRLAGSICPNADL